MFNGYLEFSGTELVNAERTEAYVEHLAPSILKSQGGAGTLHIVSGEPAYRTPLLDAAPWANSFDASTDQFYGLYPLNVTGIGDSTYAAGTTESVGTGGTTQGGRSATRDVKVSGLLVGGTELGAETGLTWLRAALMSTDCSDQCGGYLRYFLTEPRVCEVAWGPETGETGSISYGAVVAGQRVVQRWTGAQLDASMPSRATWTLGRTEGLRVEYGALSRDGVPLYSNEVMPLRVNYARNPAFRSDITGWSGSTLSWAYTTADGGFATVGAQRAQTDTPYGTGLYGDGTYGTTSGQNYGTYGAGAYGAGTYGANTPTSLVSSENWMTPAGPVTVSLWIRGTDTPITVQLLDLTTNSVVTSQTVDPTPDWQLVTLTGVTNGSLLQLSSDDSYDFRRVMCEASSEVRDYFDGDSDAPGYLVEWDGVPDASRSVWSLLAPMELVADDSDYLPFFTAVSGTAPNLKLTWAFRAAISVAEQLRPIDRTLHNVAVTQAPQIVQRIDGTKAGGGYFIQVEFLLTAGNPFSYGPPVGVVTEPLTSGSYADPTRVPEPIDDWLFDPASLVPSPPPAAPAILADAVDPSITQWQRYYVTIPAEDVADWASSVPLLTINTLDAPARQIRVRFHPNPFDYEPAQVDPDAYCADFLVSYLPPRSSLLMNGITQSAMASKAGVASIPADSILYGSTGGPMTWPRLSCGIGYVMTIDVPAPADFALFEVELQMLREE